MILLIIMESLVPLQTFIYMSVKVFMITIPIKIYIYQSYYWVSYHKFKIKAKLSLVFWFFFKKKKLLIHNSSTRNKEVDLPLLPLIKASPYLFFNCKNRRKNPQQSVVSMVKMNRIHLSWNSHMKLAQLRQFANKTSSIKNGPRVS